jgi:SAM-dependent methyltransferase
MAPSRSSAEIRDVNVRYHDAAAAGYDAKWSIDFAPAAQRQVVGKLTKALGAAPGPWRRGLEVGAGTGYLSLNLKAAGVLEEAIATDVSPGMLRALEGNARRLGVRVETRAAPAEDLPLPDASVDVVLGHAVLHHLADPVRGLAEMRRVLRPGGTLVVAGEPSLTGDRLARGPKRAAVLAAPAWRRVMRARSAPVHEGAGPLGDEGLEHRVDVHAFTPEALELAARTAGWDDVRVRGEELVANWFGWFNRTLEASAEPADVPWPWRQYAYRGYLVLQRVDAALLEPRLPAGLFYNLLLSARRPA